MDNQWILKKQEARAFIMIKRDKNTGHFTVFIWAKYKYTEKTHLKVSMMGSLTRADLIDDWLAIDVGIICVVLFMV